MTREEEKNIQRLNQSLCEIKDENKKFKEEIFNLVNTLNEKVTKTNNPIYFEKDILSVVQQSMSESIKKCLEGYNSPLNKLIIEVVNSRDTQLKKLITESFDYVLGLPEFKQSIITAFSHKVAKSIISNNEGLFDKVSNELKQDSNFKAKMVLAVTKVVEECLNK